MTAGRETQVSEAQIAVHWREEEYYQPPARFIAQANAADPALFERFSEEHFPSASRSTRTCSPGTPTGTPRWTPAIRRSGSGSSAGGSTPATTASTATSRPTGTRRRSSGCPNPRPRTTKAITYQELYRQVNEFAALLRGFCDLEAGDRVTFHLPMVPELPVSMLACARLGVIHSQVFGGFSGAACGERIADSQSRILVTMDGYYRNGELIDHKVKADEAVAAARELGHEIDKVLVWRRHPGQYASKSPMVEGRDFFIDEVLADYRGQDRRAGVDAGRGAAVPHVHQRHDRAAQGLPAQHRRIPRLRDRDVEVLPGHPPRRHLLVHG